MTTLSIFQRPQFAQPVQQLSRFGDTTGASLTAFARGTLYTTRHE